MRQFFHLKIKYEFPTLPSPSSVLPFFSHISHYSCMHSFLPPIPPYPYTSISLISFSFSHLLSLGSSVEELYCKRPIQCMASSKILTHLPLTTRRVCTPRLWCGGRTHSLGGEGVGGQYFRRQTLLCTLHL
jgi:hypothetical protein